MYEILSVNFWVIIFCLVFIHLNLKNLKKPTKLRLLALCWTKQFTSIVTRL